ncbi:uncharacterized protein EDB91DRAFT_1343243 [Suillus paluster]|uniref:uncharacterized protein n=1 Tax=Suillus paluster TaxID=48578 RepID=UPI001B87231F|nr:uncharacterized protein EDB91DRAFT_1343243 [Suillus paluster]KAG1753887.1 hypothetical protein EDB91DRAFT_1343243 [Suillus paluster]
MTESLVAVRVELPTYSLSFTVDVPISATVLDVKHAISASCAGQPCVEGQRIIWRGRYLGDQEKISDVWKMTDEQRIVHLSVHPSAWSGAPPTSNSSATSSTIPISDKGKSPSTQCDAPSNTPSAPPGTQSHPFTHLPLDHQFIAYVHQVALSKLTRGLIEHPQNSVIPFRTIALENLEKKGYVWPSVLDEPYPFFQPGDGPGLQYELMTTNGKSYLSLCNPGSKPTAGQVHALKVLTYTFSILSFQPLPQPPTPTPTTSSTDTVPPHLNELLQQLGLPPLRANPNVNIDVDVNGQIGVGANVQAPGDEAQILPDIPVRALLAPLVMWIVYEMWTNVRNVVLGPLNRERERLAGVAAEAARQAPGQGQPGDPPGTPAPSSQSDTQAHTQTQEAQGPPPSSNSTSLLDLLARIGIDSENKLLWPTSSLRAPLSPPSLMHKVSTFVSLIVLTLHPDVWNRRRAALRTREGRLRTEVNAMEREVERVEGQELSEDDRKREDMTAALRVQDGRRTLWVKTYIQRVRGGEWVDDL